MLQYTIPVPSPCHVILNSGTWVLNKRLLLWGSPYLTGLLKACSKLSHCCRHSLFPL